MKINAESLITATLTGIIGFLVERLAKQEDLIKGLVLVIFFSLIGLAIKEFFFYIYRLNKFEKRIEGDWINLNTSGSMADEPFKYALVKIDYDSINNKIKYLGYAFDENIKEVGEFRSISVDADTRNMSFDYIYDGHIAHKKLDNAKGMGEVRFAPVVKGKFQFATGNFRGVGSDFRPVYHRMAKIPDNFLIDVIHKKRTATREDIELILKTFKNNKDSFYIHNSKNTTLKDDNLLS
jgi:hypothetical protein